MYLQVQAEYNIDLKGRAQIDDYQFTIAVIFLLDWWWNTIAKS